MTGEGIMEFLLSDIGGLGLWCQSCPARVVFPGPTEGGLPIGPDEEDCPCSLEVGEEDCLMSAEYKEIKAKAEELARLVGASGRKW